MAEPSLEALSQRLHRLECESRWWKRLATLTLALVGIIAVLGAAAGKKGKSPTELRAQRLVLVDKADRGRAELLVTADNQPGLILADEAGKPRLTLSLTRYGEPSLSLVDARGTGRVVVSVDLYGAVLRFSDEAGIPRAALVVPSDGQPALELLSKDDKVLWHAP